LFSLLDVDKSEELEAPEFALGLRLVFAGEDDEKLRMAFKMIDRDDDDKISKKEIHRFLLPYMNIIVPAGAEILRPLLAWYCAETCMKNVAQFLGKDKLDEAPLEDFVKYCQNHDIVLDAAEQIDKKVYEIWLELEHESAFFCKKRCTQGGWGSSMYHVRTSDRKKPFKTRFGYLPRGCDGFHRCCYGFVRLELCEHAFDSS